MQKLLITFWKSETGAVTVDWVVLSAAIIGLGMIVLMPIAYITNSSAESIGEKIGDVELSYKSSR
ncbi:hypothetical protein EOK75_16440 (plasmid) [Pseudorhodobacter turbinis]|uniref:Pilus assembly protein n=1 Tax=Pseudorhodobacter turbinis TaxID=2500533 RepID=A0A4P8EKA8_9RHOB|nr:hypothetical protein [Pseudorhodobacter turbinis]QCO57323.1 hypothetical protein EOK75_16440 [Pseudorhodobacter turbinis]